MRPTDDNPRPAGPGLRVPLDALRPAHFPFSHTRKVETNNNQPRKETKQHGN